MDKIKRFFENILFEEVEEDEITEETAVKQVVEPVVEPIKQEIKPVEIKVEPVEEVKKEEPKKQKSGFITLGKEQINSETVEEVKQEEKKVETVVSEKPVEPEKETPVYEKTQVISPMFGVRETEKPQRKKRRTIEVEKIEVPDTEKKSVLGTVVSPIFGDGAADSDIPHDDIDPEIAKMTVQDFIEQTTETIIIPETIEEEIIEEQEPEFPEIEEIPVVEETVEIAEEIVPEVIIEEEPVEEPVKVELQDLNVTPFGNEIKEPEEKKETVNLHDAWSAKIEELESKVEDIMKEDLNSGYKQSDEDESQYESISLFDDF